jgi:cyanophycinase
MQPPSQNIPSRSIRFLSVAFALLVGLLLLPLPSSRAAQQTAAAPVAAPPTPLYQYWRTGNPQNTRAVPQGGFALLGGGTDLDAAFVWLCHQAHGGDLLVLRARGTDAYNPYIHDLCHNNSDATLVIPSRKVAFDPAVQKKIAAAHAIFIAGGDQAKYVNFWQNTPVQRAINNAIRRGVPLGGTSAGLAVQGEFMYSSQNDPDDDSELESPAALQNPYTARVTIVHNFLHIPALRDTITDSHFGNRDRMGRLLVFLARILQSGNVKTIHAIAIDQHTAVLLQPDGHGSVIGTGAAYFLKASSKASVCRPGTPLTFAGVSVVKLTAGDRFNTAAWTGTGGLPYQLSVVNGTIHSTQPGGKIY